MEPLPALSSRANASPEDGAQLTGVIGGSPPEVGVLLAGAVDPSSNKRRGTQRVRLATTPCQCDSCPSDVVQPPSDVVQPSRYIHSPEIRHAAMTNFSKFYEIASADEKRTEASSLGITG